MEFSSHLFKWFPCSITDNESPVSSAQLFLGCLEAAALLIVGDLPLSQLLFGGAGGSCLKFLLGHLVAFRVITSFLEVEGGG